MSATQTHSTATVEHPGDLCRMPQQAAPVGTAALRRAGVAGLGRRVCVGDEVGVGGGDPKVDRGGVRVESPRLPRLVGVFVQWRAHVAVAVGVGAAQHNSSPGGSRHRPVCFSVELT